MARALLALLVAGMLTLTGYYAYSSVASDEAPIATDTKPSCCESHAKKSCCSAGECSEHGAKKDACCSDKAGDCTGECPLSGTQKETCPSEGGCCKGKDKETTKKD